MTEQRRPPARGPRQALGKGLGALLTPLPPSENGDSGADTAFAATAPPRRLPLGEVYRADMEEPAPPPAPFLVDEVPGAHFAELPIDSITPNARQPRDYFEDQAMLELTNSIKEVGLLQPIIVRPVGDPRDRKYELIMGERRWRASQAAGLDRIPAIVRETEDDRMLLDALLENLHRSQLNPLEEAAAYDQLLKDFDCTHDELAKRVGYSRSQITNTLRLMKLPPSVQSKVGAGTLSAGHARALLGLQSIEEQERMAQRIVAELLSVRAVEEIVALSSVSGGDSSTPKPARKPRAGSRAPVLDHVAERLSDHLETRVKVQFGTGRGRIVAEFGSLEDLNRIVALLIPSAREAEA
jgi:ParB family chromosome partitioning protein